MRSDKVLEIPSLTWRKRLIGYGEGDGIECEADQFHSIREGVIGRSRGRSKWVVAVAKMAELGV